MTDSKIPYRFLRELISDIIIQEDLDNKQPYTFVEDDELVKFTTDFMNRLRKANSFKLYRYSPADYFNLRNLEKRRLYLSPAGKLNDIFEGIPNSEDDVIREATGNDLKRLEEIAFLKSFSEDYNNLLLWSHYTGESRGFCVEYDIKQLGPDNEVLKYLYPVTYIKRRFLKSNLKSLSLELKELERALVNENYVFSEDYSWLKDITSLFLVKGKVWSYEREWRIVLTKLQMELNDLYINKIIDFDCISGVYLGLRVNSDVVDNVKEIVRRLNAENVLSGKPAIKVYTSKLDTAKYKLVFKEVAFDSVTQKN